VRACVRGWLACPVPAGQRPFSAHSRFLRSHCSTHDSGHVFKFLPQFLCAFLWASHQRSRKQFCVNRRQHRNRCCKYPGVPQACAQHTLLLVGVHGALLLGCKADRRRLCGVGQGCRGHACVGEHDREHASRSPARPHRQIESIKCWLRTQLVLRRFDPANI
jgi:hypothetical protein